MGSRTARQSPWSTPQDLEDVEGREGSEGTAKRRRFPWVKGDPSVPSLMKVITPVCNSPEFIRIQHHALQQHMSCPYEFIVFNDAKTFPDATNFGDVTVRERIEATCKELGILCIPVLNGHHAYQTSPSHRHADTLKWMLSFMRTYPDEYLMLDSDMFPVAPVPVEKYRRAPAGAWVLQTRVVGAKEVRYVWPNLFYLDTRRDLGTLSFDVTHGCDTGGASAEWLKGVESVHGREGIYWIRHLPSCTWGAAEFPDSVAWCRDALLEFCESDVRNKDGYWCEIYDDVFFHYRAGSNWNGEGGAIHRENFRRMFDAIVGIC